jgi:hypothetical protein
LPIENDIDRLSDFLQDVEAVLFAIIADGISMLPLHLQEPARNAWPEVKSRLSELRDEIKREHGLPPRLELAGLTGANLDFKLQGFRYARKRHSELPVPAWLKRMLRWMNILLGSLATVMPGAELVKEYKDAIEAGIDQAESS